MLRRKVDVGMRPLGFSSSAKAKKYINHFMRDASPGITDRQWGNYKHCFMGLTWLTLSLNLNIKYRSNT